MKIYDKFITCMHPRTIGRVFSKLCDSILKIREKSIKRFIIFLSLESFHHKASYLLLNQVLSKTQSEIAPITFGDDCCVCRTPI